LLDRIQELTDQNNHLERKKSAAEAEYECVNVQLQQAQTELSSLKQTTRYLQAQLRDNEEMMEKVVKSERRKAKAELARMKESMLQIVEREREAMREEFQKQAAELESMLLQEQEHHIHQGQVNFTETAVYEG
jgi:chromosome segregation ATPase